MVAELLPSIALVPATILNYILLCLIYMVLATFNAIGITRLFLILKVKHSFNPIRTGGGEEYIPLPCICVCFCNYTYERIEKNLTLPDYKFGKGQYAFYPKKLSRFAGKNEVRQKSFPKRIGTPTQPKPKIHVFRYAQIGWSCNGLSKGGLINLH